ncbi:MAG: proline dehydrogenase family protein [Thermonemataceae bacterium]
MEKISEPQPTQVDFNDTSVAFAAKSDKALKKMYYIFAAMNQNWLVALGTALLRFAFKLNLPVKWVIKPTVFNHFCGGETIEECETTMQELGQYGIGSILDYSVEGEKTEAGFEHTLQETLRTVEKAAAHPHIPFSVFKVTGLASFKLLEKIQAKQSLTSQEQAAWGRVQARVDQICQFAHKHQVKILIDGEETWIQDTIDLLAYTMMVRYNKERCIVYNTFQMYRIDMLQNLKAAYEQAKENGYWLGAKLVRGAYIEKERDRAEELGYPDPMQPDKAACDADFDAAVAFCVDHLAEIGFCAGTHNIQSNQYLTELMVQKGITPQDKRVYFAQLYGMSDQISFALAKAGYNVAKYVPYGPLKAVMPYLFRRAEENTSVAGQSSRELQLIKAEIKRRKAASYT